MPKLSCQPAMVQDASCRQQSVAGAHLYKLLLLPCRDALGRHASIEGRQVILLQVGTQQLHHLINRSSCNVQKQL